MSDSDNLAADRVHKGAALLDTVLPDWRDHVDLGDLDLGDPDSCVLAHLNQAGVLHHDTAASVAFTRGARALYQTVHPDTVNWNTQLVGDELKFVREHGFEQDIWESERITYEDLEREWRNVLIADPECDGCDQDPWTAPVHYGTCPLAPGNVR